MIPLSENLYIKVDGKITSNNEIIVNVPPLSSILESMENGYIEEEKTTAYLEIISADGKYFKPYETKVLIEEKPRISKITLKEEEKEKEEFQKVDVTKVKDDDLAEKPHNQKKTEKKKKIVIKEKEKKKSGLRKFLDGEKT